MVFIQLFGMASANNVVQLSTASLIDGYQNEPCLWDVNLNANEEEKELAWARLSTMFNTSAGTNVRYATNSLC